MTAEPDGITVVPSGAALGADVRGVDLRRVDDAAFAVIRRAWLGHKVLRFRGQDLDDDALAEFSRRFGELDMAPITRSGRPFQPDRPEVTVISNIVVDGQPIGGLGAGEAEWHSDMSYNEIPPDGSLLYGIEVPEGHGDTWFADMVAAHDALPEAMRARLAGLKCKHDATRNSAGELRAGYEEHYEPEDRPGAVHPMVRTHPETGRKALFLGRRRNAHVVGLPPEESDRLLDELWAFCTRPRFVWVQKWRQGDAVLWDNRCVLHRRDPFDPSLRRLMHRTQIRGSRPY
ncbi:TauD/TfdA family dioxygenase [Caldovatus sediminis]|uniref:TauD/TfdA family dioxygenase n=1 Tax=Caldovatus sediminis TaxID=2041189 RepID=A0A8J2ZCQ1_9PROT|nr:TauD/TfdA family dioxygenase [Caldovatus sediminis]GGG37406.1 TauD/TfdA family dioxygenase [Caldovatus sediminis]